jgi:hypothetical protein
VAQLGASDSVPAIFRMNVTTNSPYAKVPAVVFGCLHPGEIRLLLCPGGMESSWREVTVNVVPHDLRMPNSKVWIELDESADRVLSVWRRDEAT